MNAAGKAFVGLCVLIFLILIGLVIGGIMLVRLNDSTEGAKQQTKINRTVLKGIQANQDLLVECTTAGPYPYPKTGNDCYDRNSVRAVLISKIIVYSVECGKGTATDAALEDCVLAKLGQKKELGE